MINPYRAGYRVAKNILNDLWKLVTLGIITKKTYKTLTTKSASEQRKAYKYYSKKLSKSDLSKLKQQVKAISKQLENDRATHVHRRRDTGRLLQANVNQSATDAYGVHGQVTTLESAMANLRYFDAATNALVSASAGTSTYQNDITVKSIVYSYHAVNNYQVPVNVRVYAVRPKSDTSISPETYFTNGLTDQGNPSATSTLVFPTDSMHLKEMWKIEKSEKKLLMPGQSIDCTFALKSFDYDPSLVDSHAASYQPKYNGFAWLYRIEGCLGHDTVADEQGIMLSGIDIQMDVKYVFEYDAGKDLHDISVDDNSNTFTNGAVASSRPVVDNIGYSVA